MSDVTRIGTVLDRRFELTRSLGAGGAGTLWIARDRSTGDDVAIKILHRALRGSAGALQRMAREAEVLMRLDHPRIARALVLLTETEPPYMAMEFVEGQNLLATIHDHVDQSRNP